MELGKIMKLWVLFIGSECEFVVLASSYILIFMMKQLAIGVLVGVVGTPLFVFFLWYSLKEIARIDKNTCD